jgi:diguanylate cyclase (GGDEF)-like protein
MEKILVVEKNRSLAKMLALKIESALPFEVHNAYSLKEVQLFIRKYDYFMALLDINLPDAPNGEAIDTVLEKGIKAIVLSGKVDKEFRHAMLKKDIIDYVQKEGIAEVDYVIATIERLHKNMNHTIMIVDDSMVFRNQIKRMLEHLFFNVIACAHGEEALGLLKENPAVSMVITDYNMPVMNGLELTVAIRKEFSKERISILAISGNNDEDISAMFLKKGATDFIKKPFSKEEFSCRINNTIEALENIAAITNSAKRDFLTGLYNRNYFYERAQKYFDMAKEQQLNFCIAMVGGDETLDDDAIVLLSEIINSNTSEEDVVARFDNQEFAILVKNCNHTEANALLQSISQRSMKYEMSLSIGFTCHGDDSVDEMLNQADMMLYNAKNKGGGCVIGD